MIPASVVKTEALYAPITLESDAEENLLRMYSDGCQRDRPYDQTGGEIILARNRSAIRHYRNDPDLPQSSREREPLIIEQVNEHGSHWKSSRA